MFDTDGYRPDGDCPEGYGPTTVRSSSWEEARAPRRAALEAELLTKLANVNAAQAELVGLIDEHAREGFFGDWAGINSEAQWLSFMGGLPQGAGRVYVALGGALRDLPALRASFAAGKLTLQQVRAVADIATAETEAALAEVAEGLTGSQLTAFCRYYREGLHANDDPAPKRHLHLRYDNTGGGRLSASLPAEQLALVERALLAMEKEIASDDSADDPLAAQRADALVGIAETSLAHEPTALAGGDRYRVIVHADVGKLRESETEVETKPHESSTEDRVSTARGDAEFGDGSVRVPYLERGGALDAAVVERILCDCGIVALLETGGEPLDIGRASRTPTAAIRRAVVARDRCCRWPGCANEVFVDTHHYRRPYGDGGKTSADDLVLLCRTHHRYVHRFKISIELTRDGPVFTGPDRRVIEVPGRRAATQVLHDEGITEDTPRPAWGGERGNMRKLASAYLDRSDYATPAIV